ncbi:MAG: peptidase M13 [Bifidobacteriaceae bacterium]|jgi:putative endopeptidase|nr:peptidase M13 [Bifidobacteriaceae bacterium]
MTESGIDRRWQDAGVRPQDDLYRHVNGQWLETFEIPADRGSDGAFRELFDKAERQIHDIVAGAGEAAAGGAAGEAGGNAEVVRDFYAAFMDTATIDAAGAKPIIPDLELIWAAQTHQELAGVLGKLERTGTPGLLALWVDSDADDPQRYAVNMAQGGLGLPDETYYREEKFAEAREKYLVHIGNLFELTCPDVAGATPSQAAQIVFDFETELAGVHWDAVAARDELKTHNPMTLGELTERAPGFAWNAWIEGMGAPNGALERVIVRQPSFVEAMGKKWAGSSLADLKRWAAWRVVQAHAGLLSKEIVDKNFEFWGPVITGATEIRERWKRGVSLVEGALGEAVGRVYVDRHFPAAHKEQVEGIVKHLLDAYRASISQLTWMGPETKAKALAKLDKIVLKIGYPEQWRDYSKLKVTPHDPVANTRAVAAFDLDRELTKSLGPVDRTEWFMSPQTVNAYYNPGMNEIVFPAAILQPPFFSAGADSAANYGGIGAVIGHEIGHAFDDQGSRFDGDGRLVDWWTEADRDEFEQRTKALIAQYDAYTPRQLAEQSDPPHVNGALTIGENIGDLGGLAIAWDAYRLSLGGEEGPVIDGATAAVRFFWGWASCWRTKSREAEAIMRLTVDPHSPAEFRCNGVVRNLDVFAETFALKPGDALWLDPKERVTIW